MPKKTKSAEGAKADAFFDLAITSMREVQEEGRSLLRFHRLLLRLMQLHRRRQPAALRRAAAADNPDAQISHPNPIQQTDDRSTRKRRLEDVQRRRQVPDEERGLAVVVLVVVIMRLHRHCWSQPGQPNQSSRRGDGRVEARARQACESRVAVGRRAERVAGNANELVHRLLVLVFKRGASWGAWAWLPAPSPCQVSPASRMQGGHGWQARGVARLMRRVERVAPMECAGAFAFFFFLFKHPFYIYLRMASVAICDLYYLIYRYTRLTSLFCQRGKELATFCI